MSLHVVHFQYSMGSGWPRLTQTPLVRACDIVCMHDDINGRGVDAKPVKGIALVRPTVSINFNPG